MSHRCVWHHQVMLNPECTMAGDGTAVARCVHAFATAAAMCLCTNLKGYVANYSDFATGVGVLVYRLCLGVSSKKANHRREKKGPPPAQLTLAHIHGCTCSLWTRAAVAGPSKEIIDVCKGGGFARTIEYCARPRFASEAALHKTPYHPLRCPPTTVYVLMVDIRSTILAEAYSGSMSQSARPLFASSHAAA